MRNKHDRFYQAWKQLCEHQEQLDAQGIMVGVSREALNIVLESYIEDVGYMIPVQVQEYIEELENGKS